MSWRGGHHRGGTNWGSLAIPLAHSSKPSISVAAPSVASIGSQDSVLGSNPAGSTPATARETPLDERSLYFPPRQGLPSLISSATPTPRGWPGKDEEPKAKLPEDEESHRSTSDPTDEDMKDAEDMDGLLRGKPIPLGSNSNLSTSSEKASKQLNKRSDMQQPTASGAITDETPTRRSESSVTPEVPTRISPTPTPSVQRTQRDDESGSGRVGGRDAIGKGYHPPTSSEPLTQRDDDTPRNAFDVNVGGAAGAGAGVAVQSSASGPISPRQLASAASLPGAVPSRGSFFAPPVVPRLELGKVGAGLGIVANQPKSKPGPGDGKEDVPPVRETTPRPGPGDVRTTPRFSRPGNGNENGPPLIPETSSQARGTGLTGDAKLGDIPSGGETERAEEAQRKRAARAFEAATDVADFGVLEQDKAQRHLERAASSARSESEPPVNYSDAQKREQIQNTLPDALGTRYLVAQVVEDNQLALREESSVKREFPQFFPPAAPPPAPAANTCCPGCCCPCCVSCWDSFTSVVKNIFK